MHHSQTRLQWDIFCKVIDNFGDIGVSWRLAADLAARGQRVRLWLDDASALAWMAPDGCAGVDVLPWLPELAAADLAQLDAAPCDVLVEAFGCEVAPTFIAHSVRKTGATGSKLIWINLEYLSAESYVERCHKLPSLVGSGPGAGLTKWFFYPGFTDRTGGLLREIDQASRQETFDRVAWLAAHSVNAEARALVSLFCYEPPALPQLLVQLASRGLNGRPVQLLVANGRPAQAVKAALQSLDANTPSHPENYQKYDENPVLRNPQAGSLLSISYLPLISQSDFDGLLWACDLNFVRGEDSVVRAIWAGKPFVWQIYPQEDGAQDAKLDAFLGTICASPDVRAVHRAWNRPTAVAGVAQAAARPKNETPQLFSDTSEAWSDWQQLTRNLRARLMLQPDLTSSLREFVAKNR